MSKASKTKKGQDSGFTREDLYSAAQLLGKSGMGVLRMAVAAAYGVVETRPILKSILKEQYKTLLEKGLDDDEAIKVVLRTTEKALREAIGEMKAGETRAANE